MSVSILHHFCSGIFPNLHFGSKVLTKHGSLVMFIFLKHCYINKTYSGTTSAYFMVFDLYCIFTGLASSSPRYSCSHSSRSFELSIRLWPREEAEGEVPTQCKIHRKYSSGTFFVCADIRLPFLDIFGIARLEILLFHPIFYLILSCWIYLARLG